MTDTEKPVEETAKPKKPATMKVKTLVRSPLGAPGTVVEVKTGDKRVGHMLKKGQAEKVDG